MSVDEINTMDGKYKGKAKNNGGDGATRNDDSGGVAKASASSNSVSPDDLSSPFSSPSFSPSSSLSAGQPSNSSGFSKFHIPFFDTLPKGIFAVSLFGLFLGASTTMIYSQLGLFLKNELHATELKIALIDGTVEFLAYLTRIFSGMISDYFMNRKFILYVGCLVTLCMKPLFAIAHSSFTVLIAQSIERIGNGLQASPRDALIADISTPSTRGQSFGFSKSFKTIGSLLGTCIAIGIMLLSSNNYRLVFMCATIAVVLAVLCLSKIKTKNEIRTDHEKKKLVNPFKKQYLKSFDKSFWQLIALATFFELGHFSEALFPIYTNQFIATSFAGSVSMFISIGQIFCSYPIGLYADKFGKRKFICICMFMMMCANLLFMTASSVYPVYLAAFLWGGQMTASQGLFLSVLVERVDSHLRGTAIGVYYCSVGVSYLIASVLAGKIWTYNCRFAFIYSLFFCIASLFLVKVLMPKRNTGLQIN